MSYERLRFQCRHAGCNARFLTWQARNGHEHVHGEQTRKEVINGP